MNNLQKGLVAVGVAIIGYQLYKHLSKPKGAETKSNVSGKGLKEGMLAYHKGYGKVFKLVGTGFDARWVQLAPKDQPKTMDWYRLNDKYIWTKWNGKLEDTKIPRQYIVDKV